MTRTEAQHVSRALTLLGCNRIERLKLGKDHHVSAFRPNGEPEYLTTIPDAERLILLLARERVR